MEVHPGIAVLVAVELLALALIFHRAWRHDRFNYAKGPVSPTGIILLCVLSTLMVSGYGTALARSWKTGNQENLLSLLGPGLLTVVWFLLISFRTVQGGRRCPRDDSPQSARRTPSTDDQG